MVNSQRFRKMKNAQLRQNARMEIVAEMYKRGYSFRDMKNEVMKRLDLKSYSLDTLHKDVRRLLDEWKKERVEKIDQVMQLELQRNNDIIKEAWQAWEKSKTDYEKRTSKQYGLPEKNKNGETGGEERIRTTKIEQQREMIRSCGDARYLEVIIKAEERNAKLLGYDSPTKIDICNTLPEDEVPGGAQYDVNSIPPEMLVEIAYKLQDAEFEQREKDAAHGEEDSKDSTADSEE